MQGEAISLHKQVENFIKYIDSDKKLKKDQIYSWCSINQVDIVILLNQLDKSYLRKLKKMGIDSTNNKINFSGEQSALEESKLLNFINNTPGKNDDDKIYFFTNICENNIQSIAMLEKHKDAIVNKLHDDKKRDELSKILNNIILKKKKLQEQLQEQAQPQGQKATDKKPKPEKNQSPKTKKTINTKTLPQQQPEIKKEKEIKQSPQIQKASAQATQKFINNDNKEKTKADILFENLIKRRKESEKSLPAALQGLITLKAYQEILDGIIKDTENIKKQLNKGPYQIKKSNKEGRTVTFLIDPKTDDFQLILETKSKIVNKIGTTVKNPKPIIFTGASKTTKPAYRIDSPVPIEMANSVLYAYDKNELELGKKEVLISQKAAEGSPYINPITLGPVSNKQGYRKHRDEPTSYNLKQYHYSVLANCGDLNNVLNNPNKYPLSPKDKNNIAKCILDALEALHAKNIIHRDIKPANILIHKNEDGSYTAKITDFGLSYHPELQKEKWDGTPLYDPPDSHLGQMTNKVDMWAVGLVLYQLYNNTTTKDLLNIYLKYDGIPAGLENNIPLIQGLLEINQENRIDVKKAKEMLQSKIELDNSNSKNKRSKKYF